MKGLKTLVTLCMVFSLIFSMTAYAKERPSVLPVSDGEVVDIAVDDSAPTSENPTPRYSSIAAFNAGDISGGYGTVKVSLVGNITNGGIQAAVSSNGNSGNILCSVTFPNGATQSLGTMYAGGGQTQTVPFYNIPSGTYTFTFYPSSTATFKVMGYIYE